MEHTTLVDRGHEHLQTKDVKKRLCNNGIVQKLAEVTAFCIGLIIFWKDNPAESRGRHCPCAPLRMWRVAPSAPEINRRSKCASNRHRIPRQWPCSVQGHLFQPSPEHSIGKAVLYEDENGVSSAAARADLEELAGRGYAVLAIDPSGIGEAVANWSSYSGAWFRQEKVTWLSLMVGKPLTGLRLDDIVPGVHLLAEKGVLYRGSCVGFGKGFVAADLLNVAVLDDRIAGVVIEGGTTFICLDCANSDSAKNP